MENVLMFPVVYGKEQVNFFKKFINKIKEHQENIYNKKVRELRNATFEHYLNKLKNRSNGIEIPYFLTAEELTKKAIKEAEELGRKHINACYKELKRRNKNTPTK